MEKITQPTLKNNNYRARMYWQVDVVKNNSANILTNPGYQNMPGITWKGIDRPYVKEDLVAIAQRTS